MPVVVIDGLSVLDQNRVRYAVLGHSFPPGASIEGVLGLDFFRGLRLTIDLRDGFLSID